MSEPIGLVKATAEIGAKAEDMVREIGYLFAENNLTLNEVSATVTGLLVVIAMELSPERREWFVSGFATGVIKTLRNDGELPQQQ